VNTTSGPATSRRRLRLSLTTTTIADITRASAISPPADVYCGHRPVILAERQGSNNRPLPTVACSSHLQAGRTFTTSMRQSLPLPSPVVSKNLTTDTNGVET